MKLNLPSLCRVSFVAVLIVFLGKAVLFAQLEPPEIDVTHYNMEVELEPANSLMNATVEVQFQPTQRPVHEVDFQFHAALNLVRVEDANGKDVSFDQDRDQFRIHIELPETLRPGQSTRLKFHYDGRLTGLEESPVYGVQFAAIKPDYGFLLYPARWFPISGYTVDRYTAKMTFIVPQGYRVIASGLGKASQTQDGRVAYEFDFSTQASFPGSVAFVKEDPVLVETDRYRVELYFRGDRRQYAGAYGNEIVKIMNFLSGLYGLPPYAQLSVVETEETAPLGYSAPGLIFLSPSAIQKDVAIRVLANQLSRQWFGTLLSPVSRAHIWLVNGFARYSEILYIESLGDEKVLQAELRDTYVDALTITDLPVIQAARYEDYSPEYWALSASKGAAILHMLRYVIGDEKFRTLTRQFPERYAWKSVTTADFRRLAEEIYGEPLQYFFIQWVESTGAPEFDLEFIVYRTQKGFRINGKITQDLDTFRMPVELEIQTEGDPEYARVEVVGTSSAFTVETFAKPLKVIIDPKWKLLRLDPKIRVAVAIRRGEQFAEIGEFGGALKEYQKALEVNRFSSLAHYRIGELFFLQRNYQSAANEFREALNGDLDPPWTEVWSHIMLGKIFDLTGQRERAINEYRQALRTNDNTQGALEEAARYLKEPYRPADSEV